VQGVDAASACPPTIRQVWRRRWGGRQDSAEIGPLLGISPPTVHNHLEKAKTVFNTPNAPSRRSRPGGGAGSPEGSGSATPKSALAAHEAEGR
jgi:hypothetical protein